MSQLKKIALASVLILSAKISQAQFTTSAGNITQSSIGNVGIGVLTPTAPLSLLEVKNGSVLFDGYTGTTPISGTGARMMWIPAKRAFRAGEISSTQWDDINIGLTSFAVGINTIASGSYSAAIGGGTTASGGNSFSSGFNTVASGAQSNAFNSYTTASGSFTTSFGQKTTAQSYNSFVIGRFNINPGTYSTTTWIATEPLFVVGNGTGLGISANNALTVLKSGNTGINTATPEDLLQVGVGIKKVVMGSAYGADVGYGNSYIGFNASRQQATGTWSTSTDGVGGNSGGAIIYGDVTGGIRFSTIPSTGADQTGITDLTIKSNLRLYIDKNGNVGIGTDLASNTSGYKLAVNGNVRAKKIVVEGGWADFVFEKKYHLKTLSEVDEFIKKNGHLPEIPSASEIEYSGIDLSEVVKLQMQKIEELTLYLIEQNKKIECLYLETKLLKQKKSKID